MLTEICAYLRNYFDRDSRGRRLPFWTGEIQIVNGELVGFSDKLLPGQYYRIIDSVLNNGVWCYGTDFLKDETFHGVVQSMAVPEVVIRAADQLSEYYSRYNDVLTSPFSSENYFGYSWSKDSGAAGAGSGNTLAASGIPESIAFSLAPWRKV